MLCIYCQGKCIKKGIFSRQLGKKAYELKDHLGNVRVTHSDIKMPTGTPVQPFRVDLLSKSEYYPYGMKIEDLSYSPTGARYGYNGTNEMDNEVKGNVGNHLSFGDFGYDTRVARRFNLDPIDQIFISNYAVFGNNPIFFSDPTGYERDGDYLGDPNYRTDVITVTATKGTFEELRQAQYEIALASSVDLNFKINNLLSSNESNLNPTGLSLGNGIQPTFIGNTTEIKPTEKIDAVSYGFSLTGAAYYGFDFEMKVTKIDGSYSASYELSDVWGLSAGIDAGITSTFYNGTDLNHYNYYESKPVFDISGGLEGKSGYASVGFKIATINDVQLREYFTGGGIGLGISGSKKPLTSGNSKIDKNSNWIWLLDIMFLEIFNKK